MPVFLLAEREDASHIPAEVMAEANEFICILQDTMEFISEWIVVAVERYRAQLLPLLTSYLAERRIIAEKTANFSILFLFSIGVPALLQDAYMTLPRTASTPA